MIVAPGQYHEQIILKEGVSLISEQPREAVIRAAGIAVQANDIHRGRFVGFRVTGEEQNNLSVGIQLNDSNVEISDNEVTNATTAAVECLGESTGVFRANAFYGNPGAGIIVREPLVPASSRTPSPAMVKWENGRASKSMVPPSPCLPAT